jgi:hypothetical protein
VKPRPRRTTWIVVVSAGVAIVVGLVVMPADTIAQRSGEPPHQRSAQGEWRLAPENQRYAAIAPDRLMADAEALTAMARHYRDSGHPQFWGRIIGTEADAQNARWMMTRFRDLGLADVHEQSFDLPPQWMPSSWSVTATASGRTLRLDTAQPTYLSVATPEAGLDLEAVYVGFASEADLARSPDVRGKAAFFYSTETSSRHIGVMDGAIKRLAGRGAAAIFVIQGIPGNLRTQFYPVNSPVPTFSLGQKDGLDLRDLVGGSAPSQARVQVQLAVDQVPGLKTATVWGTLPGATDERVYVVAHRDGWFEGANDNAAGVATMMALAEYFSNVPRAERRRTIVFLGTSGHHDNGAESGTWLAAHPELFEHAALLVNCEHTGAAATGQNSTRQTTAAAAATWYASGDRLAAVVDAALGAFGVPTYPQSSPTPAGEIGRYYRLAPSVQIMTSGFVWHSDQETAASISPEGLAAITRAYAKIIADSDAVPIGELRVRQPSQ